MFERRLADFKGLEFRKPRKSLGLILISHPLRHRVTSQLKIQGLFILVAATIDLVPLYSPVLGHL